MEACRPMAAGIQLLAVGGSRFILTCFLATISKFVPMEPMLPSPLAASLLTTSSLQRPDPKEPLGGLHNISLGKRRLISYASPKHKWNRCRGLVVEGCVGNRWIYGFTDQLQPITLNAAMTETSVSSVAGHFIDSTCHIGEGSSTASSRY
jgi:hypothetical protein